jgi:arylsulfatase
MSDGRRNVLLIVCDQLRADFLSVYGGPAVTPALSALAEQSAVFDRAYTPSPMCVPARMSLLTGLHPLACPAHFPQSVPTLPGRLQTAGYHTAAIGKMHMAPPRGSYGFESMRLAEDTGPGVFLDDYHPWLAEKGGVEWAHGLDNFDILPARSQLRPEETCTWWTGTETVDYLTRRAREEQPFYAVVSFTKPHPPYDPLPASIDAIPPAIVPRPLTTARSPADYPEPVLRYRETSECGELDPELTQRIRAHYLALVVEIDQQIARILSALSSLGIDSTTTVLFTSDHGDFLGDHHLFMKFFPYEQAARVPLLIRTPELAPGRYDRVVSLMSVVPTVLDLCGLPVFGQGPTLLDREPTGEDGVVVSSAMSPGYCWIGERYKYTFWPHGEEELYDIVADPGEQQNLAEADPQSCERLRATLTRELTRISAGRIGAMPVVVQDGQIVPRELDRSRFDGQTVRYVQHKRKGVDHQYTRMGRPHGA